MGLWPWLLACLLFVAAFKQVELNSYNQRLYALQSLKY